MTLKDFEQFIPQVILERGYQYFINHHITDLEEVEKNLWIATVEGTEFYSVEIQMEDKEIDEWQCDCPFEGEICKHVSAVLYALSEEQLVKKSNTACKKANKGKANSFEVIFEKATKEELRKFIVSQFSKTHGLKDLFVAYFADKLEGNTDQKYKRIVNSIVRSFQDKHGFINYRSAQSLEISLMELLNQAHDLLENNNVIDSLSICKIIIEEVPELLQFTDDSAGVATTLFDYAFEIFYGVTQKAPPELKDNLFNYCIEEYSKSKYHDSGFYDKFMDIFPDLVSTEEQENKFFTIIEQQIAIEKQREYSDYAVRRLIKSKIDYFYNQDRNEEGRELIVENKEIPEFMEIIIDEEIKKKDFENAIKLCYEAVKNAEKKRHPGTVVGWHEKLLSIYEQQKDITKIREMSEKLFFESHFNMKFYKKLKSTYTSDEWPEFCERIIDKIKGKNQTGSYYDADILAKIFVEENYEERLLKLLRLNTNRIHFMSDYSKHIERNFADEVLSLFEEGIKIHAEQPGRNIYNEVARYLKQMHKIKGGEIKVKSLVTYFRVKYKNRRAMLEILNKNFTY